MDYEKTTGGLPAVPSAESKRGSEGGSSGVYGGASVVGQPSPAGLELVEIRKQMRPGGDYWRKDAVGESLRDRYQDLVTAQEAGAPAPVAKKNLAAARETELAEIRKLMGNPKSAYWKGPESDALQARYLALVEARDGDLPGEADDETADAPDESQDGGEAAWPSPAATRATLVTQDPELLAMLDEDGDFDTRLANHQASLETMFRPMTKETALAILNDFQTLPTGVQRAVTMELTVPGVAVAALPSQCALDAFAATEAGAALMLLWGNRASSNLGKVQMRFRRAKAAMAPQDWCAFAAWFDFAPAEHAAAIMRGLAG